MSSETDTQKPRSESNQTVGVSRAAAANGDDTLVQDERQLQHAIELSLRRGQPPARVPGYGISECLGEGAYGSVWLARESNTGKQVAIKFYTHRRGLDWSLLNREVEKLAVLYTSRNIVRLLDVGWDSDPPYYVMEYLDNGSLSTFLADGPLPPHEAVRIATTVLQALVHAHGSGILHCDLKPANVLLDAEFEPRLCDFGQSRLSDEQKPALGTLFYMAPEQADMKAVPDARWDVYALGALLYHMLCGNAPYRSEENESLIRTTESLEERLAVYRRVVRQSPRPTEHRHVPGVDKRLAEIVDRCLQVDPEKRFPNAQAVLDALELRERQRSRRPMIALGVVGPALLFLAMIPFVYTALQNAEQKARESLTRRALESDALSAGILSRSVDHELKKRQSDLREVALSLELRRAVNEYATLPRAQRDPLTKLLDEFKRKSDEKLKQLAQEKDVSWFLVDSDGWQRWRMPFSEDTIDEYWAWRDYFHGQGFQYPENTPPGTIQPLTEPYVSLAFRSRATHRYMVAIAVPVKHPQDDERVIGILARTAHLGQLLTEYGQDIRSENRLIALVDERNWQLLDHEWMTPDNVVSLLAENGPTHSGANENVVKKLQLPPAVVERLNGSEKGQNGTTSTDAVHKEDSYFDPVGRIDPTKYGGEWLAAFAPVGDTGWTVIVQERKSAAVQPVEDLPADMVRYGVAALVVSCTLIGLMWYFVFRALNDRNLRVGSSRGEAFRSELPNSLTATNTPGK